MNRSCNLEYRLVNKTTGEVYLSSRKAAVFFCGCDGEKRVERLLGLFLNRLRVMNVNDKLSLEVDCTPIVPVELPLVFG